MKNCNPIVSLMNGTADQDKHEWHKELKSQLKKWSASKSGAASNLFRSAKLMKSSDNRVYGVPKLTNDEMKKVKACMARHYYITGMSFTGLKKVSSTKHSESAEKKSNYPIIRIFPLNCWQGAIRR
jgi:hypothetical protein